MKFFLSGITSFLLLGVLADGAVAKCGDNIGDDAAVAATRAQVEAQCPCAAATNHGAYVKCAKGVINAAVANDTLPTQCKGEVRRCAAKSTCGRPGAVTCCRTNAKGVTKCSIKKDATKCRAPKGGSACLGLMSSCCGACLATGCAGPTPTPTPSPTPTGGTPTPPPTPTAGPTPTPPYGSASKAFLREPMSLLQ
jgi:hypothetical protein